MGEYDRATVIEIVAGRHGMWGIRNSDLVPVGGLVTFRNATLTDSTWRTGGGATKLGTPITGNPAILAAFDYWPDPNTQRTLVATSNGKLYKDNGLGTGWVELHTGLNMGGAIPHFAVGGSELAGNSRKAFYADRVNAPRVLAGDGAAFNLLTGPNVDWATKPPGSFAIHQGYLWATGEHQVYRSLSTDHELFNSGGGFRIVLGPDRNEQKCVALLSYKGGLLVWKFPVGTYFINTSSPTPTEWFPLKVARPGAAGPRTADQVEDDVVWVSPFGDWHALATTEQQGSLRASDLAYRKLGDFGQKRIALGHLPRCELVYDELQREASLTYVPIGQALKTARIVLDLNDRAQVGENWITWDRDRNEAMFSRLQDGLEVAAMGDDQGQLWLLNRESRNKDGMSYPFEWFMHDSDFSQLVPQWQGRRKRCVFLQLGFDPRSAAEHIVEVWADGRRRQAINFNLAAAGGIVLGDPDSAILGVNAVFGTQALRYTSKRRLYGRATRLALRGITNAVNVDVSITRVLLGLELAA